MKQPSLFSGIPPVEIKKAAPKPTSLLGPKSKDIGYEKYIQSYEWRQKALAAKKMAGNKCQECGSTKDLEVHHLSYENLYRERYCDVKVLCKTRCHQLADQIRIENKRYESFVSTKYGDEAAYHHGDPDSIADYEDWIEKKMW